MANARGEGRLLVATIAFVGLLLADANGAKARFGGTRQKLHEWRWTLRAALPVHESDASDMQLR